jgi:DNA-binding SARP family transcriptional activator
VDAASAESLARATGTPAARQLAHAALAIVEPGRAVDHRELVAATAAETGLVLPAWTSGPATSHAAPGESEPDADPLGGSGESPMGGVGADTPAGGGTSGVAGTVRVRTLGGFVLEAGGRAVPLDGVKPRVRSVLRLLAVHAGAPVHREVIQETLWPDADATAGARSLHVALSALRKLLDDVADPPGGRLIARDGDAYRLAVAPDDIDLGRFDRAVAAGRAARARGEASAEFFAAAVDLYTGDLLPEEGPAEWVAGRRDQLRARAIEAATSLAEESLLVEDLGTAVRACRFGLGQDRYQDGLWRMLIAARERGGEAGAASRERREYALVLEALGVGNEVAAGAS